MLSWRTLQSEISSGLRRRRWVDWCALFFASLGVFYGTASANERYIKLALEDRTTLQVGQWAVLSIPSDHHYRINSAGDALEFVRRTENKAVFRALHAGRETILLSPEVPEGDCVACATHHYFITVAQPGETKRE